MKTSTSITNLAHAAAIFCLQYEPIGTPRRLLQRMIPLIYASSPDSTFFDIFHDIQSKNIELYNESLQMHDKSGVHGWLRVLYTLREVYHIDLLTFNTWDNIEILMKRLLPSVKIEEFELPSIELHGSEFQVHWVSWREYCHLQNVSSATSFFSHIVQLQLFGFPFTPSVLNALTDEWSSRPSFRSYLINRLRQGTFDGYLVGSQTKRTSVFDAIKSHAPISSYIDRYISSLSSAQSTEHVRRIKMTDGQLLRKSIRHSTFPTADAQELRKLYKYGALDPFSNEPNLKQLQKTAATDNLFSKQYETYLQFPISNNLYRYGPDMFDEIMSSSLTPSASNRSFVNYSF